MNYHFRSLKYSINEKSRYTYAFNVFHLNKNKYHLLRRQFETANPFVDSSPK